MDSIDDVRRWLAEEIMEWEFRPEESADESHDGVDFLPGTDWRKPTRYIDDEGNEQCVGRWFPDENLEQAFQVLEEYRIDLWQLCSVEYDRYSCILEWSVGNKVVNRYSDTKPKAIIGAIMKAEGRHKDLEVLDDASS